MRPDSVIANRSTRYQSIALILVSMFCFAVVDALGKAVTLRYPANEVTFFRMLFGIVPALAVCLRGRAIGARIRNLDLRGQTIRAMTLIGASAFFFAG
ncbi:MAG TPA: EamA/RhaT family transporter, partial [Bordetella sp.]